MSRSRGFVVVINNYTFADQVQLVDYVPYRYLIFSFEVGESGTPHIQGYVYMSEAHTITAMHKMVPRAHFEIVKGSVEDNYRYVRKLDTPHPNEVWVEFGEMPHQGVVGKERLDDIMSHPYENFHLYQQYRKIYKELNPPVTKVKKDRVLKIIYDHEALQLYDYYDSVCTNAADWLPNDQVLLTSFPEHEFGCHAWLHGHAYRVKRGYEIILCDPDIVYLQVSDEQEAATYRKTYGKYIDVKQAEVPSEATTGFKTKQDYEEWS